MHNGAPVRPGPNNRTSPKGQYSSPLLSAWWPKPVRDHNQNPAHGSLQEPGQTPLARGALKNTGNGDRKSHSDDDRILLFFQRRQLVIRTNEHPLTVLATPVIPLLALVPPLIAPPPHKGHDRVPGILARGRGMGALSVASAVIRYHSDLLVAARHAISYSWSGGRGWEGGSCLTAEG